MLDCHARFSATWATWSRRCLKWQWRIYCLNPLASPCTDKSGYRYRVQIPGNLGQSPAILHGKLTFLLRNRSWFVPGIIGDWIKSRRVPMWSDLQHKLNHLNTWTTKLMKLGIYCSTANKCKHFIQEDNQVHSEGTIIYEQEALMAMIPISATLIFLF